MSDTDPIGWRAIVYGTPILAADGTKAGTVREVLGSDADDIFHGIRMALVHGDRDVMVRTDDITSITTASIGTDLSATDIGALPAYDEVATYHLASVGWLRKHLGWQKDSESDEGPG